MGQNACRHRLKHVVLSDYQATSPLSIKGSSSIARCADEERRSTPFFVDVALTAQESHRALPVMCSVAFIVYEK
jgi:hypothetical protein